MEKIFAFLIENWITVYFSIGVSLCILAFTAIWCILPETIWKSIVESSPEMNRSFLFISFLAACILVGFIALWIFIIIFLIFLITYDAINIKPKNEGETLNESG